MTENEFLDSLTMIFLLILLLGLIVGSFLNVLILRIPAGQSIRGRSRCMTCQKSLLWFELVPLFSYVVLRGKCRSCRVGISLQYPLVEFATAILFLFVFVHHRVMYKSLGDVQFWMQMIGNWLLLSPLIVLFVQDLRFQILPDIITLPAIAIAIIFWFFDPYNLTPITYNLIATAIGGGFFLLQWLISRGRWVGEGDIRLGALMGAILGWPNILLGLFLSYITGALVACIFLITGRATRKTQMPFGTFLAASTVFTMFWGDQIVEWYSRIIGL